MAKERYPIPRYASFKQGKEPYGTATRSSKVEVPEQKKVEYIPRFSLASLVASNNVITADPNKPIEISVKNGEKTTQVGTVGELKSLIFHDMDITFGNQRLVIDESPEITRERKRSGGLSSNVDKWKTLRNNMTRRAIQFGDAHFDGTDLRSEDIKYRPNEFEPKEKKAVVFLTKDFFSQGASELVKYWTTGYGAGLIESLKFNHKTVEVVFLANGMEIDEMGFHHIATITSPEDSIKSYQKMSRLIKEKFSAYDFDIVPVHFSDGIIKSPDVVGYAREVAGLAGRLNYLQLLIPGEPVSQDVYDAITSIRRGVTARKIKQNTDVGAALRAAA